MSRDIAASYQPAPPPAPGELSRKAWFVELGPLRIASARSVWRDPHAATTRRATWLWRSSAVALSGMAVAALVVDIAATRATANTGHAVLQPVPVAAPARAARKAHHLRPARPEPAAADSPDADPAFAGSVGEREAIAAAWTSGDAQDWAAGGSHGVIVPGPAEKADGMVCRAFSRLTRREGAEDSVEQWRRCAPVADAP